MDKIVRFPNSCTTRGQNLTTKTQHNRKNDTETVLRVFYSGFFLKAPTNIQGTILFPERSLGA